MKVWQGDLWHFPSFTEAENQWLLMICDSAGYVIHQAKCPQLEVNSEWLTSQLKIATQSIVPQKIQIFRPQIQGLFSVATERLNIVLETTRRTKEIKEKLHQYIEQNSSVLSTTKYLGLDRPPPQNVPKNIWGENWSFVSISAEEIINFTEDRPIPFCDLPQSLLQINSKLKPKTKIPGIVIYGGRKSLTLARWLDREQPVALNYIPTELGKSGGLVLESGLVDRWILATFESETVAKAAKIYEEEKHKSQGLHFLLLQPDDSGMTYMGFWLLKDEK